MEAWREKSARELGELDAELQRLAEVGHSPSTRLQAGRAILSCRSRAGRAVHVTGVVN